MENKSSWRPLISEQTTARDNETKKNIACSYIEENPKICRPSIFAFIQITLPLMGQELMGKKTKGQTWKNHNVTDDIQVCIKHEECTNENGMLHLD